LCSAALMAYAAPTPAAETGPVSVLQVTKTRPSSAMAGLPNTLAHARNLNRQVPSAGEGRRMAGGWQVAGAS
jgi:hypothetical protein